jgi:hypothetical protein
MSGNDSHINEIASSAKSAENIKNDPRYQKLQEDLKAKNVQEQTQKEKAVKAPDFQDKVEIKSLFNWQKTKEGDFEIKTTKNQGGVAATKDIKYSGEKILRLMGYKIDFTEKMESLKENYMRLYVESKSHNLLLAKFSQVKFGMLTGMLSLLGLSTKELQDLQKKALQGSIEENEQLFAQNEYNSEMLQIFGTGKKDKRQQKIFDEVRNQIMMQMSALGQPNFFNQEKILNIKKEQVLKIRQDLSQEKQNLEYLSEIQL